MKIGEFSSKTGLPINTIRFYVDIGLLRPKKKNTQFSFEEDDIALLQRIIRLKEMGFSLKEIRILLFSYCISSFFCMGLEQKNLIEERLVETRKEIKRLLFEEQQLSTLLQNKIDSTSPAGFPLSSLSYLKTSEGKPMIENAKIINQSLVSADILTSEGKPFSVSDGVFYAKEDRSRYLTAKKEEMTIDSKSYLVQKSETYIANLFEYQNAFEQTIYDAFIRTHYRSILFLGGSDSVIWLKAIYALPKDTTIFVSGGATLPSVAQFYGNFDGRNVSYLFSENSPDALLKERSIDVVVYVGQGNDPASRFPFLAKEGLAIQTSAVLAKPNDSSGSSYIFISKPFVADGADFSQVPTGKKAYFCLKMLHC